MPELRMVFGSADVGYGLLSQCENDAPRRCRSALLVTLDGGQSWVERQLPEHGEAPLWIKVVDATTIGLFADDGPAAAWLSRDTGRTFQRRPRFPPPAETVPDGWVADCLGLDCARQVYEYRADGPHRLTTQPPLHSPLRLLKFDGTRLWAGAVAPDGRPELAVSRDRGNSWKRSDPPVAALRIGDIEITVSPDGHDVQHRRVPRRGWNQVGVTAGHGDPCGHDRPALRRHAGSDLHRHRHRHQRQPALRRPVRPAGRGRRHQPALDPGQTGSVPAVTATPGLSGVKDQPGHDNGRPPHVPLLWDLAAGRAPLSVLSLLSGST